MPSRSVILTCYPYSFPTYSNVLDAPQIVHRVVKIPNCDYLMSFTSIAMSIVAQIIAC